MPMQECKSMWHQAAGNLQRSSEEVSTLQQQLENVRTDILQPLQAEHGIMLDALRTLTQLSADRAPAEAAQPADRAHLMAPAVHRTDVTTSPASPAGSASVFRDDSSLNAHEAAAAAVRAVQQCLQQAQEEHAALREAKGLTEVDALHLNLHGDLRYQNRCPMHVTLKGPCPKSWHDHPHHGDYFPAHRPVRQ